MTATPVRDSDDPPRLNQPGAPWRTDVALRCEELECRISVAKAGAGLASEEGLAADFVAVSEAGVSVLDVRIADASARTQTAAAVEAAHIAVAERAVEAAKRVIGARRWSVVDWWSGSAVTAAWESVHLAEAELVEVAPDKDVRAIFPSLQAWMREVMTPEKRAPYEKRLREMQQSGAELDRATVREIYADLMRANNDWHAKLRRFRNLLIGVSAALGLVLLALGVWHAIHAETLSLCRTVDGASSCFGGGARPQGRSVLEVEVVGAFGGLLSVAYLLTKTKEPPSRYNLSAAQAALKPVVGAATALVAVLLLQSGILVSPANVSTESMLAYAAIFGFSQELLTRFVDKNAAQLLGEKTGKPTDGADTSPVVQSS